MCELFESYEQDFCRYVSSITKKIDTFSSHTNEKKETIIGEVQFELTEADKCFKQMDIEMQVQSANIKPSLQQKVKKYRQELESLQKQCLKMEELYLDQKNKESLMGARIELSDVNTSGQEKFIKTGDILSDGVQKLKEGLQAAHFAQEMGGNIQNNLQHQSVQMDKQIATNKEIQGQLAISNSILSKIKTNITRNKLVLWIVIFILVIAIIIICIVYYSN